MTHPKEKSNSERLATNGWIQELEEAVKSCDIEAACGQGRVNANETEKRNVQRELIKQYDVNDGERYVFSKE